VSAAPPGGGGPYEVRVERAAEKALTKRIRPKDGDRIRRAIGGLAHDPRPPQSSELRGREGRRLRIGNYRVIYEVEEPHPAYSEPKEGEPAGRVSVLAVGHRQGIYG
jgi:mRNA interferase RelE/StbE